MKKREKLEIIEIRNIELIKIEKAKK